MESKIESIRCIKCNSIMVLQRSSDVDFIRESSRYHYKCSKTKCINYCIKIFSPSITRSHEMNKQLISTKYHLLQQLQQLPVGDEKENTMNESLGAANANSDDSTRMENKVILRDTANKMIERVKLEIEFEINGIIRLTQEDIQHALTEMFEQIDLQENLDSRFGDKPVGTEINNFKCQIWKQSI